MSATISTTKKIAGVLGACAVLLAGAACTKEVQGTATAAAVDLPSSSEKPSDSSSSKSSSKSSSSESSSSSSGSEDGGTAAAPDVPYSYKDGTTVKLDAAIEDNTISGLLSNEVGRVLPFHVANQSDFTLDLSSTALYADVDCAGSSAYVFPSAPIVGPEQLATGQIGDYQLEIGLKKTDIGKTCTITIPFEAPGATSVDTATFSMVLS